MLGALLVGAGCADPPLTDLPESQAWLPSWADANGTPAAVVTRPALPFCGVEGDARTGPENPAARACFVSAVRAGLPAELATVITTTEGDPIATITRFSPRDGIELLVDSTQDAWSARTWVRIRCRGFVPDARTGLQPDGCGEEMEIR